MIWRALNSRLLRSVFCYFPPSMNDWLPENIWRDLWWRRCEELDLAIHFGFPRTAREVLDITGGVAVLLMLRVRDQGYLQAARSSGPCTTRLPSATLPQP